MILNSRSPLAPRGGLVAASPPLSAARGAERDDVEERVRAARPRLGAAGRAPGLADGGLHLLRRPQPRAARLTGVLRSCGVGTETVTETNLDDEGTQALIRIDQSRETFI